MTNSRAAAVSLGFLLLVSPAAAQTANTASREGFVIGFGLGFGASYPCDSCPGGAASFFVGAMATPRVAVVADISGVGGRDSSFDSNGEEGVGLLALGVRFWPAERFWLQAGVGIGSPLEEDFESGNDSSWAALVGAGFDVTRKGRFAMDVHVRGVFIEGRQGVMLGIGFNWY